MKKNLFGLLSALCSVSILFFLLTPVFVSGKESVFLYELLFISSAISVGSGTGLTTLIFLGCICLTIVCFKFVFQGIRKNEDNSVQAFCCLLFNIIEVSYMLCLINALVVNEVPLSSTIQDNSEIGWGMFVILSLLFASIILSAIGMILNLVKGYKEQFGKRAYSKLYEMKQLLYDNIITEDEFIAFRNSTIPALSTLKKE